MNIIKVKKKNITTSKFKKINDWKIKKKLSLILGVFIISIFFITIMSVRIINDITNSDVELLKFNQNLGEHIMKMNQNTLGFLLQDESNLDFYTTNTSENIKKFYINYESALVEINNILENKTFLRIEDKELKKELKDFNSELFKVEENFKILIKGVKERGFINFGKVIDLNASMNAMSRDISNLKDVNALKFLLKIKKYEASYLIDKERNTATKLLLSFSNLDEIIKDRYELNNILPKIDKYKKLLNELVELNVIIEESRIVNNNISAEIYLKVSELNNKVSIILDKKSIETKIIMISISILVSVLGLIIAIYISNSITKPLAILNKKLVDISEGNGDLTSRLELNREDELGEFAKSFDKFISNLDKLISVVKNNSEKFYISSVNIEDKMVESERSTEEVSSRISLIANGINTNANVLLEIKSGINEISLNADLVKEDVHEAANLSKKILEKSTSGVVKLNNVFNDIENIREQSNDTKKILSNLQDSYQSINLIVDTIKKIANKTSLLALNATIEAKRAGEYGLGFGVVAEEIRKLADDSKASSIDITTIVDLISEKINLAEANINKENILIKETSFKAVESKESFESILKSINCMSNSINNISKISLVQVNTSVKIKCDIEEISNQALESKTDSDLIEHALVIQNESIEKTSVEIKKISELSGLLTSITSEFKVSGKCV